MANQPNPTSGGVRRLSSDRVLAIGWLLLGLLIGLLIGWVVWPVDWADAQPDDLRPEARAHFISATADAYVASGGQDPNTALARMQSFTDPQAAVEEAIVFFQQSGDPKRAIREVNLRSLASALDSSNPLVSPRTVPASTDAPEISWTNWLLGILTGLLLIVGGGWIIRRLLIDRRSALATPGTPAPASQTNWVPPLPPRNSGVQPPSGSSGWQPVAPPDQSGSVGAGQATPVGHATPVGRSVQMETWDDPGDAPAFAEPAFSPAAPNSAKPRPFPDSVGDEVDEPLRRVVPRQSNAASVDLDADEAPVVNSFIDFSGAQEEEDEGDGDGWEEWKAESKQTVIQKVIPAALDDDEEGEEEDTDWLDGWDDSESDDSESSDPELDDLQSDEEDSGESEWEVDEDVKKDPPSVPGLWAGGARRAVAPPADPDEDDDTEPGILPTVQSVLNSFGWGDKEASAKSRDGKAIESYVAEYNIGIMSYEQSFTIRSSGGEEGTPLGACGMGISETLDKSAANSNNVRVLDVWLYDGLEVRTSSQYLVSPGMDKEALGEQAKSAGTITGEPLDIAPGVTFRIASKNLLLECRIVAADFLSTTPAPSPLRSVRIEMTAKAAK